MELLFVLVALVAALFIGVQLMMVIRMRRSKGKPAPELEGTYGEFVRAGGRVLFYFHSPACRMCRNTTPLVEDLRRSHGNVISVDVSRDLGTARKFGIMGTPSTILVDRGIIQDFRVGPLSLADLRAMLENG